MASGEEFDVIVVGGGSAGCVMAQVVSANTNATTIMIGERGAAFALGKPQLAPDNVPYWIHPNWKTRQR